MSDHISKLWVPCVTAAAVCIPMWSLSRAMKSQAWNAAVACYRAVPGCKQGLNRAETIRLLRKQGWKIFPAKIALSFDPP